MIIKINDNEGRKIDLCIEEFNIQIQYRKKYSTIFVLDNINENDTYLMKKLKRQIKENIEYTKEFNNVDNLHDFKKSIIKDFKAINILDITYLEKEKLKYNSLLVLENMEKFNNCKSLKDLIMFNRHLNLFLLLKSKYDTYIHPNIFVNIHYFIFGKTDNIDTLHYLYHTYCRIIPTFLIFKQIIDTLKHNEFLVIDNFSTSNLLTECIFIYRVVVDYKKWKIIGHKMNKIIQEHLGNPNLIGVRKRLLTECEFI